MRRLHNVGSFTTCRAGETDTCFSWMIHMYRPLKHPGWVYDSSCRDYYSYLSCYSKLNWICPSIRCSMLNCDHIHWCVWASVYSPNGVRAFFFGSGYLRLVQYVTQFSHWFKYCAVIAFRPSLRISNSQRGEFYWECASVCNVRRQPALLQSNLNKSAWTVRHLRFSLS